VFEAPASRSSLSQDRNFLNSSNSKSLHSLDNHVPLFDALRLLLILALVLILLLLLLPPP
jgi:hypothetical protein